MSLHGISALPGSHLTATLQPEVIVSNHEIQKLKISQRACLFTNEVTAIFCSHCQYFYLL